MGGRCAHAHTPSANDRVKRTAVLCGGAVSGRHNPNSKPVPAPWVNNNILLHPALLPARPSRTALSSIRLRPDARATSIGSNVYKPLVSSARPVVTLFFPGFYGSIPLVGSTLDFNSREKSCTENVLRDLQTHLHWLRAFTML